MIDITTARSKHLDLINRQKIEHYEASSANRALALAQRRAISAAMAAAKTDKALEHLELEIIRVYNDQAQRPVPETGVERDEKKGKTNE